MKSEKAIIPGFPRTPHLPHNPNAAEDDIVATISEVSQVFTGRINVEEKVDGASVGIAFHQSHPLIRNREHILRKGFVKDTAAKKQFAPIWNWFYENKKKFAKLSTLGPYSIYGEWCLAQHGIHYTRLPDWFIAYDIYNYEEDKFISPVIARETLLELGFSIPRLYHQGEFNGGYDELEAWANEISLLTDEQKGEGIYIKVYDDKVVQNRFKMVRPDYVRGALWNKDKLTKNIVKEKHG